MTGVRDPVGRGRRPSRRRFVGSTFIVAAGPFSQTVPAGADSCDIIAVGGGGGCLASDRGYNGGGAAMAVRLAKSVLPGQTLAGVVGGATGYGGGTGMSTSVDGMVVEGGCGPGGATPAKATGGDVNLSGSLPNRHDGGGIPSPAWDAASQKPENWPDSGGPYIHPLYKGLGSGGVPGGGGWASDDGRTSIAGAVGGVFIFWHATE